MKEKVCFCPASIKWIIKHLKSEALPKFFKMVGSFPRSKTGFGSVFNQPNRKRKRKSKRRFSRKQLAAQRLFAKRARAGTLRGRKRRR